MTSEPNYSTSPLVEVDASSGQTAGFFVAGPDGRVLEANETLLERLGLTQAELLQGELDCRSLLAPESWALWDSEWTNLSRNGFVSPKAVVFRGRDGYSRGQGLLVNAQVSITALRDGTGSGACIVQFHEPEQPLALPGVNRVHRAVESPEPAVGSEQPGFHYGEEHLRALLDSTPVQIFDMAPDGALNYINQAGLEFYGPEGVKKVKKGLWPEELHPDERDRTVGLLFQALHNQRAITFETCVRNQQGVYRWQLIAAMPNFSPRGEFMGLIGSALDITESKEAEIALRKSEERLRLLADASPAQIFDMAPDGRMRFVNRNVLDFFGANRADDIIEGSWAPDIHPDDVGMITSVIQRSLETGVPYRAELRARRNDGVYCWFLSVATPSFYSNGEFYGLIGYNVDITALKEAELELKTSEERFRIIANASPAQIFDMAPDGTLRFLNQTAMNYLSSERLPEILKGDWAPEIHPEDLEKITLLVQHALHNNRESYQTEMRIKRRDGVYRWFLHTGMPSYYPNGEFYGLVGNSIDITALKEAELELKTSEERFRIIANASPAHIFDMAPDGTFRFVNQAVLDFLAVERMSEIMQGAWASEVHPDDLENFTRLVQQALEGKLESYRLEFRSKRRDGVYRWFFHTGVRTYYPNGEFYGLVGYTIDITALKEAEFALRESEERFRIMADVSAAHIFEMAPSGDIRFINRTMLDFYSPEQIALLKRGDWYGLVHPDDIEKMRQSAELAVADFKGYRIEVRFLNRDGQYRWLLSSVLPSLYPDGSLHGLVGSAIDITDIKQTEFALRESEERFRIMADASPLQIYDVGPDGRLRYVNKATEDFYGPENVPKLMDHGWLDFVHPEDQERMSKPIPEHSELELVSKEEFRIRRRDGSYRWVMTYTSPSFYPNGELHGLVGSAIDITERKEMEQALRESEARWREMANVVPIILWVCNLQGEVIFLNDRWYQYTGLTSEQSLGAQWIEAVHPDDRELVKAMAQQYLQGVPFEVECRYRNTDGDYRWHFSRAVPVKDANGNVLNWYGSSLDVHDRRLVEQELSKARDIAEEASKKKSQFLANMSHELRTPLNAVIGFSDMLRKGMAGPLTDKQGNYIEHISTSGRHLLAMVNDILDISKAEAGRIELFLQYVELEPFIKQLRELVSYSAEKSGVTLTFEVQPGLVGLVVDSDRLKQIFLNLLSNAIKFNHPGGQVNVFLARSEDHQWVVCDIRDTGIGIPADKIGNLFNEFYQVDSSNARRYEGTGLGLALTKRLVELHHGTITVESQENVGSTFTFRLPLNPYAVGF